jgi:FtsP/CotA-like multicopper oxidase with cupredoxin domain
MPLSCRNRSDDIHPVHLHRHSFELTKFAGKAESDVWCDEGCSDGGRVSGSGLCGWQSGLTLFHCHQQLHMDFGFMSLFDYV